jgi:phage replication protein
MMSNHHLRNKKLSLKAVGLMSKILSLPDEWDYSLKGLAKLNTDGIDGVRSAVQELEDAGYIIRRQRRDKNGRMAQSEYLVFEIPELAKPASDSPASEKPMPVKPATDVPTSGNPMQINTNQVITHQENTLLNNTPSINHSGSGRRNDRTDWMDERERYKEIIEENIEYEIMKDRPDGDRLGEIVEIMLDAVCSTAPTIRINGEDMPQQVVKSRFLKLDSSHIEYVFHAMKECPSDIRNIRAYLLTTLYNAPATMGNFYSAKVNHDFNGW